MFACLSNNKESDVLQSISVDAEHFTTYAVALLFIMGSNNALQNIIIVEISCLNFMILLCSYSTVNVFNFKKILIYLDGKLFPNFLGPDTLNYLQTFCGDRFSMTGATK